MNARNESLRRSLASLAVAALAAAIVLAPEAKAQHVEGSRTIAARTSQEWIAEWWQYMLSFPAPTSPLADATGAQCGVGQHGAVWFLAPTLDGSATRACTIPQGKALLFPLVDAIAIGGDAEARARDAATCIDGTQALHVEIDGKPAPKIGGPLRARVDPFDVVVPADGLLPEGVHRAVAVDGWYMLLPPLRPGSHVVRFGGAIADCALAAGWRTDVTYRIQIVRAADGRKQLPARPNGPGATTAD